MQKVYRFLSLLKQFNNLQSNHHNKLYEKRFRFQLNSWSTFVRGNNLYPTRITNEIYLLGIEAGLPDAYNQSVFNSHHECHGVKILVCACLIPVFDDIAIGWSIQAYTYRGMCCKGLQCLPPDRYDNIFKKRNDLKNFRV